MIYTFGDFQLDEERYELRRVGAPIRLEPKVFRILAYLIRQWNEAAALTLPRSDFPWHRFPQSEAVIVFARVLGAVCSVNLEAARKELTRLQELRVLWPRPSSDIGKSRSTFSIR